jgi:hypothetical protein
VSESVAAATPFSKSNYAKALAGRRLPSHILHSRFRLIAIHQHEKASIVLASVLERRGDLAGRKRYEVLCYTCLVSCRSTRMGFSIRCAKSPTGGSCEYECEVMVEA